MKDYKNKPHKADEEYQSHRGYYMNENDISRIIIECSIEIHKELGPGLLESVYEKILAYELFKKGLQVEQQKVIAIKYKNISFEQGFRADLIINDKVIVEIKSVKDFESNHFKQLLTYLRLANKRLGLLLNFNKELMKQGIKRIINSKVKEKTLCPLRAL